MSRTHFTTFNRLDEDETNVEVEYMISPFYPATWDDPAEGGEVEIIASWIDLATENGVCLLSVPVTLTDAEKSKFSQWISENHDHDDGPDTDDERDRIRDDKLTGYSR